MSRYLVVNKNHVKYNLTHDDKKPVLSIHDGNKPVVYANNVEVYDEEGFTVGKFVYDPERPKGCGASVWFELINFQGVGFSAIDPQNLSEVCENGEQG